MMVSLDGYFEGVDHDLSWHNVDNEFNDAFAIPQLKQIDTILFGRRTYDLMASYWPTVDAAKDDPVVAKLMNETAKVVFSHTLDKAEWSKTRLVSSDPVAEVAKLKQSPGKDIAIFGSNNLCLSLLADNLIDEFRIMINPVVVGKGIPLFAGIEKKAGFKLLTTRNFKNGNVLLTYSPA